MREVKINRRNILREDGKLFNIKTGKEFIPTNAGDGYYKIGVNGKTATVHSLVMQFFGPPKPGTEYVIDHINRIKTDNRIENLRWVTIKENVNNTDRGLSVGNRLCDFKTKNEYNKNWRHNHKKEANEYNREYLRKWHAKKSSQ